MEERKQGQKDLAEQSRAEQGGILLHVPGFFRYLGRWRLVSDDIHIP